MPLREIALCIGTVVVLHAGSGSLRGGHALLPICNLCHARKMLAQEELLQCVLLICFKLQSPGLMLLQLDIQKASVLVHDTVPALQRWKYLSCSYGRPVVCKAGM